MGFMPRTDSRRCPRCGLEDIRPVIVGEYRGAVPLPDKPSGRAARDPGPIVAEASPLPAQDGVGRHDHERVLPVGPHPGEPDPEEPISGAELRPSDRSSVHGQLVAQGEILEDEVAMAADEEGEESKN